MQDNEILKDKFDVFVLKRPYFSLLVLVVVSVKWQSIQSMHTITTI